MSETKVAIVDFGMGNLYSVKRVCEHAGLKPVITHEAADILAADGVVLPGVGAFGDAMRFLKDHRLDSAIKNSSKPAGRF